MKNDEFNTSLVSSTRRNAATRFSMQFFLLIILPPAYSVHSQKPWGPQGQTKCCKLYATVALGTTPRNCFAAITLLQSTNISPGRNKKKGWDHWSTHRLHMLFARGRKGGNKVSIYYFFHSKVIYEKVLIQEICLCIFQAVHRGFDQCWRDIRNSRRPALHGYINLMRGYN